MNKLKALLIGRGCELMRPLPEIFVQAGFTVDVIASTNRLKKDRLISHFILCDWDDIVSRSCQLDLDSYDIIVICSDDMLKEVVNATISLENKLKLLPVISEKDFTHLYSKIGLSQLLLQAGMTTPEFAVAYNLNEIIAAAEKLTYPVMVKNDSSGGGFRVFKCEHACDVRAINPDFLTFPVLVQKKIEGYEVDLSAFYRESKLIHFTYSKINDSVRLYGPSSLRTYYQLGVVDRSLFAEMEKLGRVLGADGFINVSAIKDADGHFYFFEADMRPNVWVACSKFFGDSIAPKITKWFVNREFLNQLPEVNIDYPQQMVIPYCFRLSLKDVIMNRYKVWNFMGKRDVIGMIRMYSMKEMIKNVIRFPERLFRKLVTKQKRRAFKNFFSFYKQQINN